MAQYLGIQNKRVIYGFTQAEHNYICKLRDKLIKARASSRRTTPLGGRKIEDIDLDGLMGEAMFHFHCGQHFNFKVFKSKGDLGYDIIVKDRTIQIKTTPSDIYNPHLLQKVEDVPKAEYYALVKIYWNLRRVALLGYASREELIREENRGRLGPANKGYPENYMLRENDLHRFTSNPLHKQLVVKGTTK